MPSEAEILNALYTAASAPSGTPGWPAFLALLAEQTGAGSAALRLDRQGVREQDWHWHDPKVEPPARPAPDQPRMRFHRIYGQGDLPSLTAPARDPLRAVKTQLRPGPDQGNSALLILQRKGDDFRATAAVHLSTLIPHLGPALETWERLAEERARAGRYRAIARHLGGGWVLFSPNGTVLEMDPALRAPLEAIAGIRVGPDGRLLVRDTLLAQELKKALSSSKTLSGPDTLTPKAHLLRLSEQPLMEMMIRDDPTAPDGQPRRIGYLRSAPMAEALPLASTARHLGLSPSEAKLACLICDGHSLAEAAHRLSWTIDTTRTTSKRIFARMDVTGQAGVMRKMLTSALWFDDAERSGS
ncbi:helix-turn-helix transcriptional regulator [Pseudooceanicola sp. 502str34]